MAAAFVPAKMTTQRSHKLRPVGVIFHGMRITLGIGQHFTGGIDDGCPRPRRLRFLRGDVGQGVLPISLHALREHQGLLVQIALDLRA